MQGYDLDLIRRVADAVTVPVVAYGGAGNIAHLAEAIRAGASAAAAGSMFVFQGPLRGVLDQISRAGRIEEGYAVEKVSSLRGSPKGDEAILFTEQEIASPLPFAIAQGRARNTCT